MTRPKPKKTRTRRIEHWQKVMILVTTHIKYGEFEKPTLFTSFNLGLIL